MWIIVKYKRRKLARARDETHLRARVDNVL